jgi:predicted AAA+ superfamily ATPase
MTAQSADSFLQARENPERWGSIAESAIGAHLANGALTGDYRLFYWREASKEVDYVLQKGNRILALEVKSGHRPTARPGMAAFDRIYAPAKKFLVGTSGMSFKEFLSVRAAEFF